MLARGQETSRSAADCDRVIGKTRDNLTDTTPRHISRIVKSYPLDRGRIILVVLIITGLVVDDGRIINFSITVARVVDADAVGKTRHHRVLHIKRIAVTAGLLDSFRCCGVPQNHRGIKLEHVGRVAVLFSYQSPGGVSRAQNVVVVENRIGRTVHIGRGKYISRAVRFVHGQTRDGQTAVVILVFLDRIAGGARIPGNGSGGNQRVRLNGVDAVRGIQIHRFGIVVEKNDGRARTGAIGRGLDTGVSHPAGCAADGDVNIARVRTGRSKRTVSRKFINRIPAAVGQGISAGRVTVPA